MITPINVANNFIKQSLSEGIPITPLKLQKLIYFVYKEYLKSTDKDLFSERFETWKYGPVLPSVYSEFSSFGQRNINKYAKDSQNNIYLVRETGEFQVAFLKVWGRYKHFEGSELSDLTHQDGTAWSKACQRRERFLSREDIKDEKIL